MQAPVQETNSLSSLLSRERLTPLKSPGRKVSPLAVTMGVLVVLLIGVAITKSLLAARHVEAKTVQIVGAGQDILPGTRITFGALHYLTVPLDYYSEDMLQKNNLVVGRVAKNFISKGEPITTASLFTGKDTLSSQVETHERAITLKLDDEALVDHGMVSGDRVDVIFTTHKDGKQFTSTICQNLPVVFCLPKEALRSKSLTGQEASRVTLAVSPEEAEVLAQAQETGKIKLSLRNRLAVMEPKSLGVGEEDLLPSKALTAAKPVFEAPQAKPLFDAPPPPPTAFTPSFNIDMPKVPVSPPVREAAKWVVEVISGSHKENYEFPQGSN